MKTVTIDERTTTIDNDTGDVQKTVKGKFNGFGQGLRDYVMKGPKQATPDVTVNVGQLPAGHLKEGKWAVQIIVSAFDEKEDAETVADRLAANIKVMMQPTQTAAGVVKR
jgi:hypothetical protein